MLLAGGVLLLAIGIQKETSDRGPTAAVAAFLEAVKAGDQQQSLTLLSPRQQVVARSQLAASPSPWLPSPRLKYEIERVEEFGNRATAHVLLKESGLRANSEIEMRRTPEGVWLIREIRSQPVSALAGGWHAVDSSPAAASTSDVTLERELRAALLKAPGVIVHRESDIDTIRR